MQSVLTSLQEQKNWKELIKKSCRRNKISVEIASFFTPNKIRVLYERFAKLYESKAQDDCACWFENQLKAFHWFLVVISGLKERQIENFAQQEWKIMSQIFLNKDTSIMEYEAIKLVNERINKNRPWSEEQTDLLTEIIKQYQNSNKWNDIARKLFQRSSHKFFRSGKQCRERWLNHLDPNKKRGEWNEDEDKLIINFILFNGRRWSSIAKELGNHRTEHMVKNRFKTLIIRQKKLTPRISNENSLLREIGKRLIGEEALPPKRQTLVKKEIEAQEAQLSNINQLSEENEGKYIEMDGEEAGQQVKKTEIVLPHQIKDGNLGQKHQQINKKAQNEPDDRNLLRDPVLAQVVEEYSKGMGSVSTPLSNYELQQIYSPFYINYQGLTPYLSTSPSLPFFMNSSFSTFDNSFNQNLFIRPSTPNSYDKKEEGH